MHRMASVGFLPLIFLAACARPGPGPSQSPPGAAAVEAPRTSEAIATPAPPPVKPSAPQVASKHGVKPVPASPAPAAGVAQASSGAVIPPSTSKAASPSGSTGGAARAPAKPSGAGIASQRPAAQPELDLAALEDRLRNTRAIGVFTKLSLKNNVDDLLAAFRAFYSGQIRTTLAELRQRYDILVMKVLTLVQNGDAALAQALAASRDSIWGILSDREKFQKFSLH